MSTLARRGTVVSVTPIILILALMAAGLGGRARADVAPGPPLTKDQVRRGNGVDDCKTKKAGDACTDMHGFAKHCGFFTWWWKPGTNERGLEGGSEDFASYDAQCTTVDKKVDGKVVQAFRCLVCK